MPAIRIQELERIAVFRALNLGDLLCAMPALRALRGTCPHAEITLIGLPWMAPLALRFSAYIDVFVSFPGMPGLPEQDCNADAFCRFIERESEEHFDLLLQMHGNGAIANPLVGLLGARRCAGFYERGAYCPDPETFMLYPEGIPEVRRHLRLMEFLGIGPRGEALEFPVFEQEWRALDTLAQRRGFDTRNHVCIHPGARDARRWWKAEKFAEVADALARAGHDVVFTGTDTERATIERVRACMRERSISLAGETDLGLLGALIGRARLLVSNDTGVSHVAAALGTPSVVIFLASDPDRWAPLDGELHRIVQGQGSVDVDAVLLHIEQALGAPARAAAL